MKKLLCRIVPCAVALFVASISYAQTVKMLSPLTTFGALSDGSIQPPNIDPVLSTGSNERGLACDPTSGNLVFVVAGGGAGGTTNPGNIYIVDGTYGTNITTLNTNGMIGTGQTYADFAAAVADDGVVYVCNHVNTSVSQPVIIYRWDSVTSTDPPMIAFSNTISPGQRWVSTLDIRGSGTGTQIIIGSQDQSGSSGTNVVIFTTANGTNFVPAMLATDATTPNFKGGIAFFTNNTFWTKAVGAPLRLMSFSLATSNATTLASFTSANLPGADYFGPIAVDAANKLLAVIEEAGGVTAVSGGPEIVRLYDISNPYVPVLLDIKTYQPNNANTTTPVGYLDFGGGKLYAHVINNGLMAYNVDTVSTPALTLLLAPAETNRIASGASITLTALAYPAASYRWLSNGVNITGATNASLTLANVTTNFAALYSVVITNSADSLSRTSRLEVVNPADLFHLSLLWRTSVTDGQPYINLTGGSGNTPSTRWMAYNALSNHLLMAIRSSSTTSNYDAWVVNATNGAPLYKLNTNGITLGVAKGGIGLVGIGVADDGAVYACNSSPDAAGSAGADPTGFFRVYRWANDGSTTVPVQVFQADPASQSGALRWGDTMAVRGSGTNTQILVDCGTREASNTKKKVAILTPTDPTMTLFTSLWIQGDNLPSVATNTAPPTGGNLAPIGRSLEFDSGNAGYWQKNKSGWLVRSTFDTNTAGAFGFPNIDYSLASIYMNNFGNGLYGLGINKSLKLAAGVSTNGTLTVADKLNLYDISTPEAPLLLAQYSFPTTPANANANFIGNTFFASNSVYGAMVFSLDCNNGIMAFQVRSGPLDPPTFVTQPQNLRLLLGASGSLAVSTLEPATFQWQKLSTGSTYTNIPSATGASYAIANAQTVNGGSYRVLGTNFVGIAATSAVATVTVVLPQDTYSVLTIWSNVIGSEPYLKFDSGGSTPFVRSLGYSAVANQLLLASRNASSAGLLVNVLDPDTGAKLYELNTNGIAVSTDAPRNTDNIILSMIGVADDGAIYAGNVSMANNTTTNAEFHLYRWADSSSNTVPVLVYSGEPANAGLTTSLRWGDVMHVRGSGINTEVILDNQRGSTLSAAVVFSPTDGTMTTFTNQPFIHNYGTMAIGRSIQFGATNTVWQKGFGNSLKLSRYDLLAGTSTILTNFGNFPATLGGLYMNFNRNLAVGVDFTGTASTPDTLNLYEISDLSLPLLITKFNFPTNQQANVNHISHAVFTPNKVFALDANNGILAFSLSPQLNLTPEGSNVILSWVTNFAGFNLQASPSISAPITWTNVGTGTIVGGNYVVTNATGNAQLFYRLAR